MRATFAGTLFVVALSSLLASCEGNGAASLAEPRTDNLPIGRRNGVPAGTVLGTSPSDAEAAAILISNLSGSMTPNAASWGDPDKLWFTASSWSIGLEPVWVEVDGTVESGGYMADDFLTCGFLYYCQDTFAAFHDCHQEGAWYEAKTNHSFAFSDRTIHHDPKRKYIECVASQNNSGGGPGGGDCVEGYWQQWFYYVDGEVVEEWWEFQCGFET